MRGSGFRRGSLSRLGGLVNKSLDELGVRHRILEHQAADKWKQVVGPHIATATVVERVHDGILFVCCKSSVWANECTFHKQHIITQLNRAAGKKVITDIRFSSRGFKRALELSLAQQATPAGKSDIESIELDSSELEMAEKLASVSPSEELAKKIQRAVLTSKRRAKS